MTVADEKNPQRIAGPDRTGSSKDESDEKRTEYHDVIVRHETPLVKPR